MTNNNTMNNTEAKVTNVRRYTKKEGFWDKVENFIERVGAKNVRKGIAKIMVFVALFTTLAYWMTNIIRGCMSSGMGTQWMYAIVMGVGFVIFAIGIWTYEYIRSEINKK